MASSAANPVSRTGYLRDEQRSAGTEKQAPLTQSIKVFNYVKLAAHFLCLHDHTVRAFSKLEKGS